MGSAWDRHPPGGLASLQDALVRTQVRDVVAPHSPFWRARFDTLGLSPGAIRGVADLSTLPSLGERDVTPEGDPAGMARLVLQGGEPEYALHAAGPQLRHALRLRARQRDAYRRVVDADTRPTSYAFCGSGFRYPVAYTRNDLDIVTRAGARLWALLGLSRNDALVGCVAPGSTEHRALEYAALGAGAPAVLTGAADLPAVVRLAPPTVLAVPTASAVELIAAAGPMTGLRTLVLVGAPDDAERAAAGHAVRQAGARSDVAVLAVHAPAGARLLWAECRPSGGASGLHTYPDLDVVQVVDPDTGESTAAGHGELVLTQLGLHGSALLRWRTADVVASVTAGDPCPACGRTVPRVQGTLRGSLVVRVDTGRAIGRSIDLRALANALLARTHLHDWRVVVGRRDRDGAHQVVVHMAGTDDEAQLIIAVATDIRDVAGTLPTQLVVTDRSGLLGLGGRPLSTRILVHDGIGST